MISFGDMMLIRAAASSTPSGSWSTLAQMWNMAASVSSSGTSCGLRSLRSRNRRYACSG